jgi:N-acetylglucosamine kinase-like BadF-type ATPase
VRIGGQFAPQVFEAAHQGDEVAQRIVRRAGTTIGQNVVAVARRLDMLDTAFDLVAAGGVFSSRSALLQDALLETLHAHAPQAKLVHWQAPPVVGALLLALDLLHPPQLPDAEALAVQVVEALAA